MRKKGNRWENCHENGVSGNSARIGIDATGSSITPILRGYTLITLVTKLAAHCEQQEE